MKETQLLTQKNFICNFRAPGEKEFLEWKEYCAWAKEQGLDVCHLTLSLVQGFMKGIKTQVTPGQQIINIKQNNSFLYQVQKPRREPYSLSSVKEQYQRTFSSVLFESYVLEKARHLNREWSYMDFLELKDYAFRRIALRLKRKGKILAIPERTVPRFYILAERIKR